MDSKDDERVAKIKAKWNDYSKSNIFDALYEGTGYLTIGYYNSPDDTIASSVLKMARRHAHISEITSDSHVLDLGCGKGRPVLDIAVQTGCSVVGLDLTEVHVTLANQSAALYRRERKADLKAEFYAASYFQIPEAVMKQRFSHVIMMTSLFYSHNRVDEIFAQVARLLESGGVFLASDFVRVAEMQQVTEFMELNSMPLALSLEEMKDAFGRHGLSYIGGEDLDAHCIKTCEMQKEKAIKDKIDGVNPDNFFRFIDNRISSIRDKCMSFQFIMAKKI